jgi:hypothetical protein
MAHECLKAGNTMKTKRQSNVHRAAIALAVVLCGTHLEPARAADPIFIANWPMNITGGLGAIFVTNDVVFGGTAGGGLNIVDATDHLNPRLLGSWQDSAWIVSRVIVSGNYAYLHRIQAVISGGGEEPGPMVAEPGEFPIATNELKVIDIADPANPRPVGSCILADSDTGVRGVSGFTLSGDFVYLTWTFSAYAYETRSYCWAETEVEVQAGLDSGLDVLDVSTPSNPHLTSRLNLGAVYPSNLSVSSNYAFIAVGSFLAHFRIEESNNIFAGMVVVDISSPATPRPAGQFTHSTLASGGSAFGTLAVSGSHAWLAGRSNLGCWTSTECYGDFLWNFNDFCYQSEFAEVLDLTDPTNPRRLGDLTNDFLLFPTVLSGDRAYVPTVSGLQILDLSDPLHPAPAGTFDGRARGLVWLSPSAFSGNYIYCSIPEGGLAVLKLPNHGPIADASATRTTLISPNNLNATVQLDGSRSSDSDGDLLHYAWRENPGGVLLGVGVTTPAALGLGEHAIELSVSDDVVTGTTAVTVRVITAGQAVSQLTSLAGQRDLPGKQQPLLAVLNAAMASYNRGDFTAGNNQLSAFKNKVRAQLAPSDPALAAQLTHAAQSILNALD